MELRVLSYGRIPKIMFFRNTSDFILNTVGKLKARKYYKYVGDLIRVFVLRDKILIND